MIAAVSRQGPDMVPFEFNLAPALQRIFTERTGAKDWAEYYKFPMRWIGIYPTRSPISLSTYYGKLPPQVEIGEDGIARFPGSLYHFRKTLHPLEKVDDLTQAVERLPLSDVLADYRYAGLKEKVDELHIGGLYVIAGAGSIFEAAWEYRGMDNLLFDFVSEDEGALLLLDRITEQCCGMARRMAQIGVDQINIGDDVAMQDRLLMSASMWRRYIKPRFARIIESAKEINPGIFIWYHCDGKMNEIVPDLMEIGVNILNPVQPECVDPVEMKRLFGDKLSFWGTIGTQTTMPFGTPDDVRNEVRERISTVGSGGGLVLSPTHMLEPDVPWENIEAFIGVSKETKG